MNEPITAKLMVTLIGSISELSLWIPFDIPEIRSDMDALVTIIAMLSVQGKPSHELLRNAGLLTLSIPYCHDAKVRRRMDQLIALIHAAEVCTRPIGD